MWIGNPQEDSPEEPRLDLFSPEVLDHAPAVALEDAVEQIDGIIADLRRKQLAMLAALDRQPRSQASSGSGGRRLEPDTDAGDTSVQIVPKDSTRV